MMKNKIKLHELNAQTFFIISLLSSCFWSEAFHHEDGKEDGTIYVQTNMEPPNEDAEVLVHEIIKLKPSSAHFEETRVSEFDSHTEKTKDQNSDTWTTLEVTTEIPVSTEHSPQKTVFTKKTTIQAESFTSNSGGAIDLDGVGTTTSPKTISTKKPTTSNTPPTATSSTKLMDLNISTTIATTTAVPVAEKPKIPLNNLYCLCDLHIHACDMNCCCDIDCSEEDRVFFSTCKETGVGFHDKRSVNRRQRSCYKSFVTFKNYETYNLQRTDNGMLCILRDNNKEDNELSSSTINELSEKILKNKMSIRDKYEWGKSSGILEYKLQSYKYGSPILGVRSSELSKETAKQLLAFGLPSSYHDTSCSIKQTVRFLENFHSRCQIKLLNISQDCERLNSFNANFFVDAMYIVVNPGVEDPQLIHIDRGSACNGDLCTTETDVEVGLTEFSTPTLNRGKNLCQDVLVKLNLTIFFHLNGISEIIANAELQDLPINNKELFQEFRAKFVWSPEADDNSTNSTKKDLTEEWPRSGNPGYIVGKPIIMGEKVKVLGNLKNETKSTAAESLAVTEITETKEMVLVWKDPSRWMTIHSPGICPENPQKVLRRSVLFDYGHSSACSLNITKFKYCEDLQIQIAKILFGENEPLNYDQRSWQVAAYGNSNPAELSEWVPLTYKNFPISSTSKLSSKNLISKGCDGLVVSMHINIAYAFVGAVDFPQARITGVLYQLGESTPIFPIQNEPCALKNCPVQEHSYEDLTIKTTVSFKDVTSPPVTRVAKWPVVSIQLPKDFFYPFSSPSSTSKNLFRWSSMMTSIILFTLF